MTDYEDLAFEPALSWEDLEKQYGGEDGLITIKTLKNARVNFWKDGVINVGFSCFDIDTSFILAENVSYERMKTIIDALTEKNDERTHL